MGSEQQLQQTYAKRTILKNVRKQIDQFKEDELIVGDKVGVRMDQVSNNIRSLVKANEKKNSGYVVSSHFQNLKKDNPQKKCFGKISLRSGIRRWYKNACQ